MGNRGEDGWMASPLSGHDLSKLQRQRRTGKPGMLQSMVSQSVRHD